MITIPCIALALLFSAHTLCGQEAPRSKSDKLFNNMGYGKYIEVQNKNASRDYNQETLEKLGMSYRKTGDVQNAAWVYEELNSRSPENLNYMLYYAQALQGLGNYAKARRHYLAYHEGAKAQTENYKNEGLRAAEACERVQQFRANAEISLRNEEQINGAQLDFSPAFYGRDIVFVSTQKQALGRGKDKWINDNFMDLYLAKRDASGELREPKLFDASLNTRYHEGPLVFSSDLQEVYFTRNNYLRGRRGKSSERITKLKIYRATKYQGRWQNIEALPFTSDELSSCHPALSADGQVLVFAQSSSSDNMDLYVSYKRGTNWTKPEPLGEHINSSGNELFPFLHEDGTLFFASTGHQGLGGLDIFMCSLLSQENGELRWSEPVNIGAPFNTSSDDFGLILDRNKKQGYLSSNREGGMGGDDIYSFKIASGEALSSVVPRSARPLTLCVYDALSNKRIEGASLSISSGAERSEASRRPAGQLVLNLEPLEQGSDKYLVQLANSPEQKQGNFRSKTERFRSDEKGTVPYALVPNMVYVLEVQKPGYEFVRMNISLDLDFDEDEYCIPLYLQGQDPRNPDNLAQSSAYILDKDGKPLLDAQGQPLPNSSLPSSPPQFWLDEEGKPKKDKNGNPIPSTYPPSIGDPQEALGKPSDRPLLSAYVFNKDYDRPLEGVEVRVLDRCTGEERVFLTGPNGIVNYPAECGCDYVFRTKKDNFSPLSKVLVLSDTANCKQLKPLPLALKLGRELGAPPRGRLGDTDFATALNEGDIIELRNIFYDYNQSYIRPDAAEDLEHILRLMQAFPSMQIELSSHTDSRGTLEYNDALSTRRAQAAKAYLCQKGIAPERIIARGYGERRLRNGCDDMSPCTEFEHQRNRRTEVFVLRFDKSASFELRYEDNKPRVIDPKRN